MVVRLVRSGGSCGDCLIIGLGFTIDLLRTLAHIPVTVGARLPRYAKGMSDTIVNMVTPAFVSSVYRARLLTHLHDQKCFPGALVFHFRSVATLDWYSLI